MHTYKRSDVVTVFNQTMGGKFIVEGKALIFERIQGVDEQYLVRFVNEPEEEYERFVDPAGQRDPVAHVQRLNAPRNLAYCSALLGI